ncbi:MAG TPA: hypothetical protein VGV15_16420 [Terriglobales bacterium]|nr:hypothetical protein [Terriglobales bacterium]
MNRTIKSPWLADIPPPNLRSGVIQKLLRYALSAKFVVIENSEASSHLYRSRMSPRRRNA